ncbi:MAG: flagellar FlbD family protein [Spirochaetaceae bacterium]|nr:flagellar FlbD family protein [Spirochaetaceae bacterium]MBQ4555843.1 flagellar FlbD family protein [Spirochaetaceae bacterium]
MIEVTRLNGVKYWVNPHQIETIEQNPDVTLVMLSGKTLVIKEKPDEVIEKIIAYRRKIANQEF